MPQIDQLAETFSSQAFWLLVFFGISFFVVGNGAQGLGHDGAA